MFQREDNLDSYWNILQNLIEKYPLILKPLIDNAQRHIHRIMYLDNALSTAYNFNLKILWTMYGHLLTIQIKFLTRLNWKKINRRNERNE